MFRLLRYQSPAEFRERHLYKRGSSLTDEKYQKRAVQEFRQQQRRLTILVLLVTILFLLAVFSICFESTAEEHITDYLPKQEHHNFRFLTPEEKAERGIGNPNGRKKASSWFHADSNMRGGRFFGGFGSSPDTFPTLPTYPYEHLQKWLEEMDHAMVQNVHGGIRWIRPSLLVSLDANKPNPLVDTPNNPQRRGLRASSRSDYFKVSRHSRHGMERSSSLSSPMFSIPSLASSPSLRKQTFPTMAWEEDNDIKHLKKKEKEAIENDSETAGGSIGSNTRGGAAGVGQVEGSIKEDNEEIYYYDYPPPKIDYTREDMYSYPDKLLLEPPQPLGSYPKLKTLEEMFHYWPQDALDDPPIPYEETLMRFDYSNQTELYAAYRFRNAKLPFKVYNVPEINNASTLWKNDEYVSAQFDRDNKNSEKRQEFPIYHHSSGVCQESTDNFFAFYTPPQWDVNTMGLPPTRNNDWTYKTWSHHAKYADAVGLDFDQPHFYWQAGVDRDERTKDSQYWTFISQDLPSFSKPPPQEDDYSSNNEINDKDDTTNNNGGTFFQFDPKEQKGIQCRFGERGVVAATHFDGGRNMVAMLVGAKRYILSPPTQCSKLGIVRTRGNAIFRHSLLNLGHVTYLDDPDKIPLELAETNKLDNELEEQEHNHIRHNVQMTQPSSSNDIDSDVPLQKQQLNSQRMSMEEFEWLQRAKSSLAVDTILKAGEVLYIPSHWFHYIISVQKSAQCNVRSGIDREGDSYFGGRDDVNEPRCDPLVDDEDMH